MNIPVTDEEFDTIYPQRIRRLGCTHWTPIEVAKIAAEFLAFKPGVKILDIGSGAGKFCLAGSALTEGYFVGVEQRESLYRLSTHLSHQYSLTNIEFIQSNITDIKFKEYQSFYFFNSFYENIDRSVCIDRTVNLNKNLYRSYSRYMREQLALMPVGTRLVTFCSDMLIIPKGGYDLQCSHVGGLLKMWIKID